MNDFQMSSLASAHVASLRDEALRQRLAAAAKPSPDATTLGNKRQPLRSSLVALLARVVA